METFFEYIERKSEMPPSGDEKPKQLQGKIEFRNVCFTYPTRPTTKVLKVLRSSLCVILIAKTPTCPLLSTWEDEDTFTRSCDNVKEGPLVVSYNYNVDWIYSRTPGPGLG